jgi:hypothetical protein
MKSLDVPGIGLIILAAIFIVVSPDVLRASWYVDASKAASQVGGPSRYGPFATRAEAEAFIERNRAATGIIMTLIPGGCDDTPSNTSSAESSSSRAEAERRKREEAAERQRKYEEEKKQEAEEARRKQEEFEKARDEAFKEMKGIAENELGMKGATSDEDLGLKGVDKSPAVFPGPFVDSSVVDLRDLVDPDKPIIVDPNVPRGRERISPAQIDPAVLQNAAYVRGFEDLMRPGVEAAQAAVEEFNQALRERPRDPLFHNGLLLAEDILKRRQQVERDNKTRAAQWTVQSLVALAKGENGSALAFITRASGLAPDDTQVRAITTLINRIAGHTGPWQTLETRAAYQIVGSSLVSMSSANVSAAIKMLEAAKQLLPKDPFIADLLSAAQKHGTDKTSAPRTAMK